jgi:hypothetical protein
MTPLEAAVVEVASVLESLSVPYMLIGGLAVSIWGEARATLDADFSLWVRPEDVGNVVRELAARLKSIPADAMSFVAESRVLPVITSSGVRADLVFARLEVEKEVIARATPKTVGGKTVMVASVEDLIWMKLISERHKDLEDARRLLRRFASTIDHDYLRPRLKEIADAFARHDVLEIYRQETNRQL